MARSGVQRRLQVRCLPCGICRCVPAMPKKQLRVCAHLKIGQGAAVSQVAPEGGGGARAGVGGCGR